MAKALTIESLLKNGSAEWNRLRKAGKVGIDHTGATLENLFSANADLSGLQLIGSEWDRCDLSKVSFKETDLSNAYFHGGRLQDCDFRGANLEGATFEKLKLLRCDFSGAQGLEGLDLEDVDMDRVVGLDGEEAPPPPPPPAVGATSFTREQRHNAEARANGAEPESDLPMFRPQDSAGTLLFRGLKKEETVPAWVLDTPLLRPPVPPRLTPGNSLEAMYREATKAQLENRQQPADPDAVKRAQAALRLGSKEAAVAAMYLRTVDVAPLFRFSSSKVLKAAMRAELDVDDLTASVDPRVAGALSTLKLPRESAEQLGEVRRRLAATQLFTSLLEAGFHPDNNWQEAVDASEQAVDLATVATQNDRAALEEGFRLFSSLPEEARLRRLAYLGESAIHLETLSRLGDAVEPAWLQDPETRECDDREMTFVRALKAEEIPTTVAALAKAELGVPEGSVPEDSEGDLFIHLRCDVCGKEKLLVQSP